MSFKILEIEKNNKKGFKWAIAKCKCGEYDSLSCKTLFDILNIIGKSEERYKNNGGVGWEYFASFVYDCCNPYTLYEDLEKKYKIPKKWLDEWM